MKVVKFVAPMLLWLVSLFLANLFLTDQIIVNPFFLLGTLTIALMGSFSQFTSWSIGGEKGVKADSLGKYTQFSGNFKEKSFTFKIYSNEDNEMKKFVEALVERVTKGSD